MTCANARALSSRRNRDDIKNGGPPFLMSSRFLRELSARAFAQVIESKLDEDNRNYHGSSNRDIYGAGDKRSDCVGQSLKVDILIPLVAVVPVDTYLSPQLI